MSGKLNSERDDMELSELFRSKLENSELEPGPSVNSKLMKKLARREFTSFIPSRFNIYYLGGIIATGVAAAVLLLSGNEPVINKSEQIFKIEAPVLKENREYSPVTVQQNTDEISKPSNSKAPDIKSSKSRETKTEIKEQRIPARSDMEKTAVSTPNSSRELIKSGTSGSEELVSSTNGNRFVTLVSEGCVPLKVVFANTSLSADSCLWSFGDGGNASGRKVEWIFDLEGEYKVTMKAFSGGKLISSCSENIKVYPRPVANFEILPEKPAIPEDEIRFVNYSADAVRYSWDFGDGSTSEVFEPLHRYEKYDNYNVRLTAVNEYGCSDSLLISNAFAGSKYFIEFPNAFIPNSDGPSGGYYTSKSDESAQVFHPVHSGVTEYQLKIFSKIGILIFESTDVNIGWDGYFNGQLSNSGVYIWKVRGKFRNGEPFTKMGDVTLLKY
jgi:PKD repeat protein